METLLPTPVPVPSLPKAQSDVCPQAGKAGHFGIEVTPTEAKALLYDRASYPRHTPGLHIDTNKYRHGPNLAEKDKFRAELLISIRKHWANPDTEVKFMKLLDAIEENGAGLFGAVIDSSRFKKLIEDFEVAIKATGNNNFLHSYVNLADHPSFLTSNTYSDAFSHPLLVSLIAYRMGGAIRINDIRGKNTPAISVKAQDNMLHLDNTPFRQEHKILLTWKRGQPLGPAGQNFTFIPGTHKGNRDIMLDADGQPWSSERDTLFASDAAIDSVFKFQKEVTGREPTVVEVEVPGQPVSTLFYGAAVVHHRYRTEHGDPRSCIIAAYQLAADNPGSLITSRTSEYKPESLADLLIGPQNKSSSSEFLAVLSTASTEIEKKIDEIFESEHSSSFIDVDGLALSEDRLKAWRKALLDAPTPSAIKFANNVFLSDRRRTLHGGSLINTLATAMVYDKHGLLHLILYEDGRDETRKIARKLIGEMKDDVLAARLSLWLPVLYARPFTTADLPTQHEVREMADHVGKLADDRVDRWPCSALDQVQNQNRKSLVHLRSLSRLVYDLGEAMVRCEEVEMYVSTSLYLFWAVYDVFGYLEGEHRERAWQIGGVLLRNYVALVLLEERLV